MTTRKFKMSEFSAMPVQIEFLNILVAINLFGVKVELTLTKRVL